MKLSELQIGNTATIRAVGGSGALRQHFLDMGLIQGTEVTVVQYAPMGDPVELRIHGYELTIRLADAENIEISEAHPPKETKQPFHGKQRAEGFTAGRMKILCRRERLLPSPWWGTRTAERRRCLIS